MMITLLMTDAFINAVIWYVYCLISGTDFDGPNLTVHILTGKMGRDLNLHIGCQNAIHAGTGQWDNGLESTINCTLDGQRKYPRRTNR